MKKSKLEDGWKQVFVSDGLLFFFPLKMCRCVMSQRVSKKRRYTLLSLRLSHDVMNRAFTQKP